MNFVFLGSGFAFTVSANNYQSNILVESRSGEKLLIGCGSDIRFSLYDQGLDFNDLDAVFINDLHSDQVGGLEWFAFLRMFASKKPKPFLYLSKDLKDPLWKTILSGGLKSIEGIETDLSTYFNVQTIDDPGLFSWQNFNMKIIKNNADLQSYGLMVEGPSGKVYFTGNVEHTGMQELYDQADLIFHVCTANKDQGKKNTVSYQELTDLSEKTRNKMWLYYYNDGSLPDAKKDGFKGFVRRGQRFSL